MQCGRTCSTHAPMDQRALFMAKLIRDYKIDIQALDAALSGGTRQEPHGAAGAMINQSSRPLQEFVQTTQQSRQQRSSASTPAEKLIAAMAAGRAELPPS